MEDLTRTGLLSTLRILFSVTTVALILSEAILGNLQTHLRVTGLALLSLSFMMLSWGAKKYLDGDRNIGLLGTGVFLLLTSVVGELIFIHS